MHQQSFLVWNFCVLYSRFSVFKSSINYMTFLLSRSVTAHHIYLSCTFTILFEKGGILMKMRRLLEGLERRLWRPFLTSLTAKN